MIHRIGDVTVRDNICRLHLKGNVTEPIISIHWISRAAKSGRIEAHEFWQSYWGRLLMSILVWEQSQYPGHNLTVQFKLLHHFGNIGWTWRIVSHPAKSTGEV